MQINIHWRNWTISEKKRPGTQSRYKTRKDMHLNKNKNHQIDWETTKVLDNEKDYHRRIIKESLYINAFRNEKLMNLEDGKPINPIWKQFNAGIRKLSNF